MQVSSVRCVSYDLHLFEPQLDRPLMDQLEELDEAQRQKQPDEVVDARKRRLADALKSAHPRYEEEQLNYAALAEHQGISEAEARQLNRDINLFDGEGLEIGLGDQQAYLTFPYWESLDLDEIIARIEEAVSVIRLECPTWILYDPQLDRAIDPIESQDAIRLAFGHGSEQLQKALSRPLWKRLLGRD